MAADTIGIDESRIQEALGDRYTIVREIGSGGMAVVYLAQDHRHDRQIAIKVLRPDLFDAATAERFLREIRLEGRLQHPHILPMYESGTAGPFLYYVMPYVDGETLEDRLRRDGALPVDEAVRIGREVADALAYAHAQRIVHRDVKPGNILLAGGHAVLADFGVASALMESAGPKLTRTGVVVGTPLYMSPEQVGSEHRADHRSDIYSLGCVLFEMLAGEPPFTGRTPRTILAKHAAEPLPSLHVLRPGLPPDLVRTVEKTLAKAPADRFPDARLLLQALDGVARGSTTSRSGWSRVRTRSVAVVSALSLVFLAIAAYRFGPAIFAARGPALDANKVVVFPLANRSGGDPDGGAVELMIGVALDHTEPLRWLPGWNWLTAEQRQDAASPTHRDYRDISRSLGAGFYVTGQVLTRPDSIAVVLLLHDARGDSIVHQSAATAALGVSDVPQVAIRAVRTLLPSLVDPGRQVDLSLISDRAPAAIANWIQGERQYRWARFPEALAFYRRAIEEDSLLVFAALKGAQAANWSHQPAEAPALIEHAMRHRANLPVRHRLLLEGLHAYRAGEADTALARVRGALAANPQWSEAWTLLGEVHQHLLPRGVSTDSARAYFEQAAQDPGFIPPLIHLTEAAIRDGRIGDAARLRQRLADNGANQDVLAELELMERCVRDGPGAAQFTILARTEPRRVYNVSVLLSGGARQAACARAGFEALLTSDAWATEHSWAAAQALHGLLIAQGEAAAAEGFLTSLIESGQSADNAVLRRASNAGLFLSVLSTLAGAPMPGLTERTERTARELYGATYDSIRGVFTPWLLGNWHAYRGDAAELATLRDHLRRRAVETGDARAGLYDASLSAQLLLLAHDTVGAIAGLRELVSVANSDQVQNDLAVSLAPERLLLARLHLARGSHRAAHDVAASFDHPGPMAFLMFVPQSLRIRRDAALAMRDATLAEQYARRLRALGREDLLVRS